MKTPVELLAETEKSRSNAKTKGILARIVNRLDTTDGRSIVIKIGDRYFRVRELG